MIAQAIDDRLDDGKAEARAEFTGAQHAMEGIEDPLTIFRADSWARVLDSNLCAIRSDLDREIDPAAFRSVANRVVDEVLQQHRQIDLADSQDHVLLTHKPHIEALGLRQRHQVLERASNRDNEARRLEARRLRLARFVLRSRKREQLIQKTSRSQDSAAQIG
jgi:hypothetical protein